MTTGWMWLIGAVGVVLTVPDLSMGMSIPEDMEILDGYDLGSASVDFNPEDDFYERRSLLEPFYYRAIRDKRDAPYRVLESPGLRSHFRPVVDGKHRRIRRNIELEVPAATAGDGPEAREELPTPEKQTLKDRAVEQWAKTPYRLEFPPKSDKEASDTAAESSMMNEGIKTRAPRVNFITQKNRNLDTSESREEKERVIQELYQKPFARMYYDRPVARAYDSYSAPSQSPMYPRVYNKYDQYHRDMMDRLHPPAPHRYDDYYQRRYDVDYDSYFPRYKFPFYYYYPDKRYDVPSYYRDRNYLHTNDVMDHPVAPPPLSTTMRNRRIIYYATLPEIVRTPPNVDLRYRNYNKYNNNGNRYDPYYTTSSPLGAYKNPRPVTGGNRDSTDRKEDKYVSSTPIKIVREANPEQETPEQSSSRRRFGEGNRPNGHDTDRSYFGRNH